MARAAEKRSEFDPGTETTFGDDGTPQTVNRRDMVELDDEEQFSSEPAMDINLDDDSNDDVDFEIEDDTPPEDRDRRPPEGYDDDAVDFDNEEEIQKYSDNVQHRIRQYSFKYHNERRAREQLAREQQPLIESAQRLMHENERLRQQLHHSNSGYMTASDAQLKAQLEGAEAKLAKAHEEGDTQGFVKAQSEIASIQARRAQLEAYMRRQPPQQAPQQPQQAPAPTGYQVPPQQRPQPPQQPQIDKPTREWMQKNPWFGAPGNEMATQMALALDRDAKDQGFNTSQPEYWKHIDTQMKQRFPEVYAQANGQQRTQRSTPKVAGAQRDSGKPSRNSKQVTLTKSEVSIAKKLGVPLKRYAAQKRALENGGIDDGQ